MTQIPVTILTGYLGSGKTTLLNHLLQHPALATSAVIINEFGDVGIDHLLVSTPTDNVVLLDTGCLCCTVRGDLTETLADLHEKRESGAIPRFTGIVIETTGLADPVPVLQTVVADPELGRRYRLSDVVTLVDAVHGEAQLDRQPESVKQAAVADALLITKTDLASEQDTARLRARLRRLNPGAEMHDVLRGAIDPGLFLRGGIYDVSSKALEVERWLKAEEFARADADGHRGHRHDSNRHDQNISTFCVYRDRPIRGPGLMMWLDMLAGLRGANLLRVKGLLNVEGEPVVIQAVQSVVHEPVVLDAWPGDDRRSRLVFIARDMAREDIERTFEAFDYSPRDKPKTAIDPRAYAQFVEAMRGFRQEEPR